MDDSFSCNEVDLINICKHKTERDESNSMENKCSMNAHVDEKEVKETNILADRLIKQENNASPTDGANSNNKRSHEKIQSDEGTFELDTSQGSFYSRLVRKEGVRNLSSLLCEVDDCSELVRKEGARNLSSLLCEVDKESDLIKEKRTLFEVRWFVYILSIHLWLIFLARSHYQQKN